MPMRVTSNDGPTKALMIRFLHIAHCKYDNTCYVHFAKRIVYPILTSKPGGALLPVLFW